MHAYEDRPLPDDVVHAILEAGRSTGSSKNMQMWRFIVMTDPARQREVGGQCSVPKNFETSAVAVAVAMLDHRFNFDAGRVSQNMMVAAWAMGVGTSPNSPNDQPTMTKLLGLPEGARVPTILTMGYPAEGQPQPPRRADPRRILERIKRLSLDELVHRDRFRAQG